MDPITFLLDSSSLPVCLSQTFTSTTYHAEVSQNGLFGDAIPVTVECTGSVIYSIHSFDPNITLASIDPTTGSLTLAINAVELSLRNYTVILQCRSATDPDGSSDSALLTIQRIESNDHPPEFTSDSVSVEVSESRDVATDPFVTQLTASDEDLGTFGTIAYSLAATSSLFAIESESGNVTLQQSLDYDTDSSHTLLVIASNPPNEDGTVLSDNIVLTVNVLDINDEPPIFTEMNYQVTVPETTSKTPRPADGFYSVTCTDLDSDDSAISYSTVSDSSPFLVDSTSGELSLTEDLDYETTTSYTFTVGCSDNGDPSLNSTATVDVIVSSVNEHDPLIQPPPVSVIPEGAPVGTNILMVVATDPDDGIDGIIYFTISEAPDPQFLNVNITTGVVYVAVPGGIDFDSVDSPFPSFYPYSFGVTACNVNPPTANCRQEDVVTYISGVNEFPPMFSMENYALSYPENTEAGTTITTVSCSDADRGVGEFCKISFGENVTADLINTFQLDEDTGNIILRLPLDYENATRYGFEVVCEDKGGDARCDGSNVMLDSAIVEVVVEPQNDNDPHFTNSGYNFNVSRTTPADRRTVGVTPATDDDQGLGGDLEFSITLNGFFDITDEGEIQIFNSVFNHSSDFIALDVAVFDGDETDTALVIIMLTEGNLNSPKFVPGSRVIEVSELSPVGTSVLPVECTDADTGVNGEISYSIISGNTDVAFRVNVRTGEVSVNRGLILPQNSTSEDYTLVISCDDGGVPMFTDFVTIFIRVYLDDSLPPTFPNDTIVAFVSEDAMLNFLVTTVVAVDLDSETLLYEFETQSVPGVFTIGISTGEVIVSAALDRESISVYTMSIVVTESRQSPGPIHSDNASLIIYVRDVNDNTPSCTPASPLAQIDEILQVGSTIIQLNCSDPDIEENGNIVFSLTEDYGILAIDASGRLSLNQSLSLTDQNTLVVGVVVADQGASPRQQTIQATIFISSVNRNAPSFTNLPANISVSEAQAIQTVFFSIDATDPDRGSFGEVTYTIVDASSDDDIGLFSNTGGVYLRRKLDFFRQNEYVLNITAADTDFAISELLTILVVDANEFSPECSQLTLTMQVEETFPQEQALGSALSCSDSDIGSNGEVIYSITSGSDGVFEVLLDGSFRTLSMLDYDNGVRRYEMEVNVSDSGSPPQSLQVAVVIQVTPVNEFSPQFHQTHYSETIVESARVQASVLQLMATDGDSETHAHGILQYQITGLANPVFSVSSSGQLEVAGDLDREDTESYIFTVIALDHGTPPRTAAVSVTVTVTDIDDNAPVFTESIYVAVLNGTAMAGSQVVTVECTDADEGTNSVVTYSLVSSDDAHFFSVDGSGRIEVAEDLPVSAIYLLSVACSGPSPANFSDSAVVSIQVLVESNITFFPSSTYFIDTPEDTSAGIELSTVSAISSTGAQLFYSIVGSGSPFGISHTTGALQLLGTLDYEDVRSYSLQVRASDNGRPPNYGVAVVQVAVVNINDEIPTITTTNSSPITIQEEGGGVNLPATIREYVCTDSDDGAFGNVIFSILSGNGGQFSLSSSGVLIQLQPLDYEEVQTVSLEVVCADGGVPSNTDTITVSITVTPINDNPPLFPAEELNVEVTENLPSGSQVGAPIVASDADLSPHGTVRYSILSGNSPRMFALSSEMGQLTLVQRLDFETTSSYSLTVLARDSGGTVNPNFVVLNDTVVVTITVSDYNDNAPHFTQDTYSGTISEEAAAGGQVALTDDIFCSDADSGDNGAVVLSIIEDSPFVIQGAGLVVLSDSEQLDFEQQQLYILVLECRDGGQPQQVSTVDLIITLQDVNEFGPEFNTSSYTFGVSESTSVGSTIGEVFASDQDAGDAGAISYSIRNGSEVPFTINPTTGVLTLASSLDYETQPHTYILQVEASDASELSEFATVIVEVENEDDNLPSFTRAIYYTSVRENAEVDTSFAEVSCSDEDDAADDIAVVYGITDTSVPFALSSAGQVTVTASLDLETIPRYTVLINCSDSAQNIVQATLTIDLLPFNDFPPVLLNNPPYETSLTEDPPVGTSVFQVSALDDDLTLYDTITFSFESGNEAMRFSIDPTSGEVTTADIIDREEEHEYLLVILARNNIPPGDTSGSLPLSSSTTLNITITDLNDNTPSINPTELTIVLPVSTSANATLVDLQCTDADAGANGETSFSITSLQIVHLFELSETGVLSTTGQIEEDVVVIVTCSDGGTPQRSSSARVTVEALSMNDNAPVFTGPSTLFEEVREDTAPGEQIGCFPATDADSADTPEGTLEYSLLLEEGDTNRFYVDGGSGCVFVALSLDFDVNRFYRYRLEVRDMGEPVRSAAITLTITLLDVVRDPPFVIGTYTRSISEGVEAGTLIVIFQCEDMDVQDMLYYSIIGGNTQGLFTINEQSGRIEVAPRSTLDYESSTSHILTVQCIDMYNLTDSGNVFITVNPVNEFTPSFEARHYTISEHSIAGTLVATLNWEDLDTGPDGEVTFSIITGDPLEAFQVLSSGQLLVRGILDREVQDEYHLFIEISDQAENAAERRNTHNLIDVTLSDINDNQPLFLQEVYEFGPLGGSESVGHVLGWVNCSDSDVGPNADTSFSIVPASNDASLFSVNSSGFISVAGNLSSRLFDNITFFVQCTDSGSRPMAGLALVIVPVQEVNIFPPVFFPTFYYKEVSENTPIVSVVLLRVHATDRDTGVNGRIQFSLSEDFNNTFFIDADTGELSLLRSLDFETTTSYQLEVVVSDGAQDSQVQLQDTATVNITVSGVNEFSPYCPDPIYVAIINRTTSGDIVDLGCLDDDRGEDGELTFIVTAGNEEGFFAITPAGVVFVPAAIAPDDDTEQYVLKINVSDSANPAKVTEVELIAIYSFDNLDTPSFNRSVYTLSLSESTEVGVIVETITAIDSDLSLQGMLVYSLLGSSYFRIDAATGDLFLSSPLDYETMQGLTFTVSARDSDPYAPLSGSASINVLVENENDNTPLCDRKLYSTTILSTTAPGDTILTLNCSDVDGNSISFSAVTAISNPFFTVHPSTGEVSVTTGERLVAGTTTVFDVSVSDGERATEISVSVAVRFSNTYPPLFDNLTYTFVVPEDSPLLKNIGSLTASDPDSSDLTFYFVDPMLSGFYISPTSGTILLTVPLDYETTEIYHFSVGVRDGGSHDGSNSLSASATVTVVVENTNDNVPRLSDGGIYGAVVNKTTPPGTAVLSISCTDRDNSPFGSPVVTAPGFSSIPFEVVGSEANYTVQVKSPLLASAAYFVNITCTDGGGDSDRGEVFIFVPEPNAPAFSQTLYNWALAEDASTGTKFTDITATSSDMSEVQYDIADGNADSSFYIDPSSGEVILARSLDFEMQRTHGLIVQAIDGESRVSRVLLLIEVLDIDDQVPLTPPSERLQVSQSSPIGFPFGTLECSDEDSLQDAAVFNFMFVPSSDLFSVDQFGVVRLEGVLGATPVHVLPVICYDTDTPKAVSTGIVTVEVLFANEAAPQFEYSSYAFSISEEAPTLSFVGVVSADDSDIGSYGDVAYTITDGNRDKFYIEAATGRIGLLTSLDRETVGSYTLTVEAVDGGLSAADSTRQTGTTSVLVLVEDANDVTPTPEESSHVVSITTDHPIHSSVLSVPCSDADLASAGTVHYSLFPSSVPFSVQSNGTILLDEVQTDQIVYTFDVICTDGGLPPLSSSALVTVIVDYVQLGAPQFDRNGYNATISEDDPIQTTIAKVHATTSDASVGVIYQLESGDDLMHFQVDPSSGDVIIRSPLDASERQHYILTVRATNTGRSPLSSFTSVNVTVTDINDHAPRFSSAFHAASLPEGSPLHTPVTKVECSDEDITAEILYSLAIDHTSPLFAVTQDGVLAVAGVLDYELASVHNVIVTCTDGGPTPRTTETTVRVDVVPVNEFVPVFERDVYQFMAKENAFGASIGNLSASDGDAGVDGDVIFLLQDPGNFSVVFVGPSSGEVLVSNNLDFETQSVWNLTVIAQDGAGTQSFVSLIISVLNVNDVLPIIAPATAILTVPHDTPEGFPLQTYSCTDEDSSPTTLNITYGNDLGYFRLSEFNQLVWTGQAGSLFSSLVVSLRLECVDTAVTDQVAVGYTAVTIQVGNLLPPQFNSTGYEKDVSEDANVGSTLLTIAASNENHTIEYVLDPRFSLPFSLNSSTGALTLSSSLDREESAYYAFPVQALDARTGAVGVVLVEITVTDVNDNVPIISPKRQVLTLSETMVVGVPFAIFRCTDADSSPNGDTVYSLSPSEPFTISEEGEVSLSVSLNFENQVRHNVTVTCSDSGLPSATTSAELVVEVGGSNEHRPLFSSSNYRFNMSEGTALGDLVGAVITTDADKGAGGQLQYSIVGGNGVTYFTINSNGEIRVSSLPTNATLTPTLDLVVQASDGELSSNAVVHVRVDDINEAPQFSDSGISSPWATNAPLGGTITEVLCFDTDTLPNAHLSLSFLSNTNDLAISLSTSGSAGTVSGAVTAVGPLPAGTFVVSLLCSDGTLNTTADITIRVEGVNMPPSFLHGNLARSVAENTPSGAMIAVVMATDDGGSVTYDISSGSGLGTFALDPSTGEVTLFLPLDFEVTQDYSFTITARDSSPFNPQSSSVEMFVFVINLNDVPPSLSPFGSVSIAVSENSPPLTSIKEFTCYDPEGGMTTTSVTPIFNPMTSPFDVTVDGNLQLLAVVDYEIQNEYHVTVTCTDIAFTSSDTPLVEFVPVIIYLTPENNFPPEFVSAGPFSAQEDASTGAVVGTVAATDRDNRGSITYTLLTYRDIFALGFESGQITVIGDLDHEMTREYLLLVSASDNDDEQDVSPLMSTFEVTVAITDVNDNSPVCQRYIITEQVLTGTYNYHPLTRLLCSDADSGQNSLLFFSLTSSSEVTISEGGQLLLNSSTGELGVSGTLLLAETVVVDVNVSDSGHPRREARVTVAVQIQSSSATVPRFTPSTYNTTVPENTAIQTVIFPGSTLTSSLFNPNSNPVSFSLRHNGQYGRIFIINSVTGDITLTDESPLDFDLGLREFSLIVEATVGAFTPTGILSIFLSDVNDNSPRFSDSNYQGIVMENQPAGATVATVFANDLDYGQNGEFVYSIRGSTDFDVDPNSGHVTTRRTLDREAIPAHSVTVFAVDHGSPALTSSSVVSIIVGDENDVAPRFLEELYITNINNVSPPGSTLATLEVEDRDEVGSFVFRIIANDADVAKLFSVSSPGGVVQQRSEEIPEDHSLQYQFTVEVNDGVHTATTDVIINIVTVTTTDLHILEDQPFAFDLGESLRSRGFNVTAMASFTIISGDPGMDFNISQGLLMTAGLDRESIPFYSLNVNMTDQLSGEQANVLVEISVEDINDHTPQFPSPQLHLSVQEGTFPTLTPLGQVMATDRDDPNSRNARLEYFLFTNTPGISINSSGHIFLIGAFDREDTEQLSFTIKAQDFGEPTPLFGYAMVIVTLVDRNDNNPQFVPLDVVEFTVSVELKEDEEVGPGTVLDGITAALPIENVTVSLRAFFFLDPDSADTLRVNLSLLHGTGKFKLQRGREEEKAVSTIEHWNLVATNHLTPEDTGTILQITLTDQPDDEEDNPIVRNVTIFITKITVAPSTDPPSTKPTVFTVTAADGTEGPVTFFKSEIGIAVIVVMVLVGLALVVLLGCLCCYGYLWHKRRKDPLRQR